MRTCWLRALPMLLLMLSPGSVKLFAESPRIVAHRGLLQHAPENTLSNFRACLELRLGFEFDVAKTRDGHLVCLHDETVNRTTNGKGSVSELTLAEIRRLDAGSWFDPRFAGETVPTIEEVFQLVASYPRHQVLIAVDLKSEQVERELVQLAQEHQVLPRLLFIGRTIADARVRASLKAASPRAQTAVVANTPAEFLDALRMADADWIYFRYLPSTTQMEQLRAARKQAFIAGMTVSGHAPENWQQATDLGIHGILTDFPLELSRLLREKLQP